MKFKETLLNKHFSSGKQSTRHTLTNTRQDSQATFFSAERSPVGDNGQGCTLHDYRIHASVRPEAMFTDYFQSLMSIREAFLETFKHRKNRDPNSHINDGLLKSSISLARSCLNQKQASASLHVSLWIYTRNWTRIRSAPPLFRSRNLWRSGCSSPSVGKRLTRELP